MKTGWLSFMLLCSSLGYALDYDPALRDKYVRHVTELATTMAHRFAERHQGFASPIEYAPGEAITNHPVTRDRVTDTPMYKFSTQDGFNCFISEQHLLINEHRVALHCHNPKTNANKQIFSAIF